MTIESLVVSSTSVVHHGPPQTVQHMDSDAANKKHSRQDKLTPAKKHEHDDGWLLAMESPEVQAGLSCTTLQSKCIPVLATALPFYIEENGVETMHSILSTFSSTTLCALSVHGKNCMDERLAYIVGNHAHVDRLALTVPSGTLYNVLARAICPDTSLRRLEICDTQISQQDLMYIFTKCPRLTHLGLRHCELLLDDVDMTIFHNLQVLDLSNNEWVTEPFLKELACHCKHLQLISVAHCPQISNPARLNFFLCGMPLISTKRQCLSYDQEKRD